MRELYLEMNSGISGDMALAALFQLGADIDAFSSLISGVVGSKVKLSIEHLGRSSIRVGRLNIEADTDDAPFRHLSDLKNMINKAPVSEKVKSSAIKTLQILGQAEADVHGVPVEEIHFHEVGAVDTLIDILGFAWCVEELKISKISSTKPLFGYGTVTCSHGVMPLPAPAVLKILNGVPVIRADIEGETTTPTGAAILKAAVSEFTAEYEGKIVKEVYSTGTKEFKNIPNFLRAMILDNDKSLNNDEVLLMKSNIDDMSGENFGFLLDTLMSNGAFDVSYSPAYGKKNRPLYMITVMLPKSKEREIAKTIFKYSTTGGIRLQKVQRIVMGREIMKVNVEGEPVRVKRLYYDDIEKFSPEWDDCVSVSKKIITTPIDVHVKATTEAAKRAL